MIGAYWIDAEDDEQAVLKASSVAGESRYELWERRRLVAAPPRSA